MTKIQLGSNISSIPAQKGNNVYISPILWNKHGIIYSAAYAMYPL